MRNAAPESAPRGVLHLVISGAPAPEGLPALVRLCQAHAWQVMVFATPAGLRFANTAELADLTGQPVRSEYRMPGSGTRTAPADAVLACPLTFTSVNKFALGIADNMAVSLLCEAAGYGIPVTAVPHCKPQLASHPAFSASLAVLRAMAVRVLYDPDAPYERRLPAWADVVASLPEAALRRG
jgi:phosphopantothenoylcysteine synthetase/decarboxylase